jgi:nuclear protein localization family protein 4
MPCSAPTTVDLKRQPYRHIDFITVNATADIKAMIDLVSVNESMNVQRGGIMYGRYAPDPNFRHGQRAVVDAIYEPPQVCDRATGAVKMLPDPKADTVAAIAGALGLQPVGWVFTRKPTVKSKGVDLMPHESYAVAAQQLKHSPRPDGRSGSQFVTLSIYKGEDSMYALQGYMVSDQCMAMVRDNVITLPTAADVKFTRRELKKDVPGELPVPEIIVKDSVRGAYRADTFDPDFCIVSIEAGAGSGSATSASAYGASDAIKSAAIEKSKPLFKHPGDFPIENRQAFRIEQDGTALQRLFNAYKTEPLQHRLSNFHVLLYLAVLLDVPQAVACAKAVASNMPVPKEIADTLSMLTSLM